MSQWSPGWTESTPADSDWVLAMADGQVVRPTDGWLHAWSALEPLARRVPGPVYVGEWHQQPVYAVDVSHADIGNYETVPLRDALVLMDAAPAELLSTGSQVLHWWHDHQYCGRCGSETDRHPRERARWCDACQTPWYPRLAPCIIVVIRRENRLLLARSSRTKLYFFSLIAGFVEPGESIEAAVAREAKEETGLDVTNIRYQTSQPWPFPHQLMLGFFADYAGGELVLQEDEIAEADWYEPGALPPVPPLTTISGRLIRSMEETIRASEASN
ncbi:NAD(+) diphosphatase [Marinobacter sp. CHS3-4]|uniref:NAD(+) diphosphatase n=1 Tax=Marinobacter sp. CHS3-4 TaxID=3045174 RepID=UPI0024B4E8C6|nr:NAD(+) diphosphatase [Marinobacter sp. CHS3-4]MDI9246100.1 NAD(+) diphosphatase [Marinobacter sp. CHS3-4]